MNYAHCAETEFVQAKSRGFSGDDLYDSATDLSGVEVNNVINFPCEEASADQLGSGAFSSEEAFIGMDTGDVTAFRWNAIARGYERLGLLNDNMDSGDVMAFRWNAIARGYEKLGLLNDNMDSGDVKAFRWNAIARGYEKLELLNTK